MSRKWGSCCVDEMMTDLDGDLTLPRAGGPGGRALISPSRSNRPARQLLSVGLEDAGDLLEDLDRALA